MLALGTNDTADVYVGSHVSVSARIERMMSAIGNQPVMWVNVRSLVSTGPYSESDMEKWDQALVQACSLYPNMKIYDWASVVQPSWFISDGIHYNTPGSARASPPDRRRPRRCLPGVGPARLRRLPHSVDPGRYAGLISIGSSPTGAGGQVVGGGAGTEVVVAGGLAGITKIRGWLTGGVGEPAGGVRVTVRVTSTP